MTGSGGAAGSGDRVAKDVRVHGRVQGVFFRDSCEAEARRLALAGWVSNRDDGTVAVHVEGDAEAVDQLVAWCRTGSERARVEGVDVSEAEVEHLTEFGVR